MKGIREGVQDLARDNRGWVAIGIVTGVSEVDGVGYLFDVALQPSGRECQARLAAMGAGAGAGMLWPIAVDDEVLVLFPDADPNRAVLLPGLSSSAAELPSDWSNDTVRVEAVGRDVEVRAGSGGSRAEVKIEASGAVTITSAAIKLGGSTATDFVALKSLVEAQLSALSSAISGAAVVAGDGGASFKAAIMASLTGWPGNVGASKVKAE